jgi:hypothetical protein
MKLDKIYIDRLLDLANEHLTELVIDDEKILPLKGPAQSIIFDSLISVNVVTAIISDLPIIFPGYFDYDMKNYLVCFDGEQPLFGSIGEFFGLNIMETLHIFCVGTQSVERFGGRRITKYSMPKDVAHNIFAMIEKQDS